MKKQLSFILLLILSLVLTSSYRGFAWSIFNVPRVVGGGSTGVFRASLDNYNKFYNSRWGYYTAGQLSVRFYRNNYITVQYAQFQKSGNKSTGNQFSTGDRANWNQRLLNVGVRWYSYSARRWRFYTGLGFTFIKIEEDAGFSLLEPKNPNKVTTNGDGFFFEIGGDYQLLPFVAINLEFEATSAGEGGMPGLMGSNLGGYAFLGGVNFFF